MNTAEYIVKRLEELGVNEFFGVPGDYNFNLLYAIENNQNTKWIGCTNELNAGYAADGYARIRGYGALVTTYGVGELSAINAFAGCISENIPIVHLVGLPSTELIENKKLIHHNFQDVDYTNFINAYKAIKADAIILSKDNIKIELERIFKILVREKKPIYIAVPEDIALMEISDKNISYEWTTDKILLEELSSKIVEKISNANNPVIIGDSLIKRFDARIEYKEFVEKSGLPVSNFLMGTNLIDINLKNYIGSYYGNCKNPIAQKYIEESDCLISVGAIYSDLNSFGRQIPYNINDHIAIYGNYTYFEGKKYENIKMSEILESVTEKIIPQDIKIDKPNIGYKTKTSNNEPINTDYIYPRIQEFIKDNDIIITETGSAMYGVSQIKFPASAEVIFQALWSSIGFATPAALGAGAAKPQSRVILITGDGAHQISALELGTMLKLGLKPVIIVINNSGYAIERVLSQNPEAEFNDILKINYSKFARSFEGDIWATKVCSSDDFDKALKVTQIMNKMCYIEICTDKFDIPPLLQDFVKNKKNETKINSKVEQIIYNDIKLSTSSINTNLQYETTVHKALDGISFEEEEVENYE